MRNSTALSLLLLLGGIALAPPLRAAGVDVNAGYSAAYGRNATPAELAYWQSQPLPATQEDFEQICMSHLLAGRGAAELHAVIVRGFLQILDRQPSAAEEQEWATKIKASRLMYGDFRAALKGPAASSGGVDVNAGYSAAYGRNATPAELAYWQSQPLPATQGDFDQICMTHLLSGRGAAELHAVIARGFLQVLERQPSAAEEQEWVTKIKASRLMFGDFRAALAGPAGSSGGVDVNAGYSAAYGRNATPAELAYWQSHPLPADQQAFVKVCIDHLVSPKGAGELAAVLSRGFQEARGREPSAAEREEWSTKVRASRLTYPALVGALSSSAGAGGATYVLATGLLVPQRLLVFAVGEDKALRYATWQGSWGGWASLVGVVNGSPDACSPNPGEVIVFLRASDNTLEALGFDLTHGASPYVSYGSKIGSDPSVVCRAGRKIDVFVRGHNNKALYHTYAEDGRWAFYYNVAPGYAIEDVIAAAGNPPPAKGASFWENLFGGAKLTWPAASWSLGGAPLGAEIKGSPDACAFGGEKRAVFARGKDDYIWWRYWNGATWVAWESLGGLRMSSDPAAISRGDGKIDLFARGENNQLYVRSFANGIWTPWFSWGGTLSGGPDATTWGGNRIDVFARGADGTLQHAWRDDDKPLGIQPQWESVAGKILGDPTAVGVRW